MSENEHVVHKSMIKTPPQLVVVVVLSFVVPVIGILLLVQLGLGGINTDPAANTAEAVGERIKPVAQVSISAAGASGGAPKTGEQVYQSSCTACHTPGIAGAPKTGDANAWRKRIAEGIDDLTKEAIKGVRGMPPRGGNPDLSDYEVARAVVFMANKSGASFKEPAAPKPAAKAAK